MISCLTTRAVVRLTVTCATAAGQSVSSIFSRQTATTTRTFGCVLSLVPTLRSAGGLGSKPGQTWDEQFEAQKFASLDFDVMRAAFEVNTVGPLLVSKALAPLMTSPGGKILIITSLMGSISDNSSGGQGRELYDDSSHLVCFTVHSIII